ncbi:MAG: hypothetical protein RI885_468 [Actinomycetota bacterium]|jgi:prepilin-type N-terminal cleavage/methylation domain-containing protein
MNFLRTLLRRARSDSGLGLTEMIVAMFVLGILMTVVVGAFSSFSRSFTEDRAATDSTMVATVGMNELSRVIRSGTEIPVGPVAGVPQSNRPVLVTASKEEMVLFSYLDTDSDSTSTLDPERGPILVHLKVNATSRDLVESRWLATRAGSYWTFPTPNFVTLTTPVPATSRIIASKIVVPNGAESPLFTYLKTAGCPTATPTCPIVPASGNALSLAEIQTVVAIEVAMKVQADDTKRANPVTIVNRVGLPNLGIARVGL